MLTAVSDGLRCSLKRTECASLQITKDLIFTLQFKNQRKHVNEQAKQHTGQSMRRFGSKTATLYMQEEALRAQNIKETLTQQLRDISHALILSSAHTHTRTHTHISMDYPQIGSPSPTFHGCDH